MANQQLRDRQRKLYSPPKGVGKYHGSHRANPIKQRCPPGYVMKREADSTGERHWKCKPLRK